MSKLARTIPAAVLVATALLAAPSGASGATTIGETFTPTNLCNSNSTRLQAGSPGDQYAAPSDGVITQWSFQADSAPPQLKFKVGRSTGNLNEFTVIGQSGQVAPVANTLNSYLVQIPVQAGDIIGFWVATQGNCSRNQPGYSNREIVGDVQPSTTAFFPGINLFSQLDVSAQLESDCDNDGLGDETQDTNLSSCAPGTIPPPAPTPPGQAPVTCKGLPATIVGTEGNDVRTGSQGQDVIAGLGGNDTLSGLGGKDVICGGSGKDTLKGGKGKDTLLGQKGKDTLKGGPGKDLCKGGKGKDTASGCEVEKSIP
jgi:Ca2+-binding RTX toxin-like protein